MNPLYQDAKVTEKHRQVYLDNILESCPHSMKRVIFDPSAGLEGAIMIVNSRLDKYGIGLQHEVRVSREAFLCYSETEFLNALIDHEGVHANDAMNGITLLKGTKINSNNVQLIKPELLKSANEVRAYRNQLKQAKKKGITNKIYTNNIKKGIIKHLNLVSEITPANHLENMLIARIYNP